MEPRIAAVAHLAALRLTTGDSAPVLAVADACPGKWWSVSAVQSLVLTPTHLHVVHRGLPGTTRRLVRTLALGDVVSVHWNTHRRLRHESVRLRVCTGTGAWEHTARADGTASALALELDRRVHGL